MKGIKFNTIWEALEFDIQNNSYTGNVTKYRWPIFALNEETVLTKAQYAAFNGIPETIADEGGEQVANPAYEALSASHTVKKVALMVGDDLTVYNDQGDATEPRGLQTFAESDFPEASI